MMNIILKAQRDDCQSSVSDCQSSVSKDDSQRASGTEIASRDSPRVMSCDDRGEDNDTFYQFSKLIVEALLPVPDQSIEVISFRNIVKFKRSKNRY